MWIKNDSKNSKNATLTIDASSYKAFINIFPNIIENIKSLGKKDPAAKKSVLSTFLIDFWTNLQQLKKTKHSATDC